MDWNVALLVSGNEDYESFRTYIRQTWGMIMPSNDELNINSLTDLSANRSVPRYRRTISTPDKRSHSNTKNRSNGKDYVIYLNERRKRRRMRICRKGFIFFEL